MRADAPLPDAPPSDATPASELELLAVDLETTGLSPRHDLVLAVGWVPVVRGRVELGGACRRVVARADPGTTVTVHGLTHDDLADGVPLEAAVAELAEALAGRVLLAHHAPMDLAFLRAAHRHLDRPWPEPPVVCTARLERRLLAPRQSEPAPGTLRLWRARARHGFPAGRAHDALGDALACAELYLAQVADLEASLGRPAALGDLRLPEGWWRRLARRARG